MDFIETITSIIKFVPAPLFAIILLVMQQDRFITKFTKERYSEIWHKTIALGAIVSVIAFLPSILPIIFGHITKLAEQQNGLIVFGGYLLIILTGMAIFYFRKSTQQQPTNIETPSTPIYNTPIPIQATQPEHSIVKSREILENSFDETKNSEDTVQPSDNLERPVADIKNSLIDEETAQEITQKWNQIACQLISQHTYEELAELTMRKTSNFPSSNIESIAVYSFLAKIHHKLGNQDECKNYLLASSYLNTDKSHHDQTFKQNEGIIKEQISRICSQSMFAKQNTACNTATKKVPDMA